MPTVAQLKVTNVHPAGAESSTDPGELSRLIFEDHLHSQHRRRQVGAPGSGALQRFANPIPVARIETIRKPVQRDGQ